MLKFSEEKKPQNNLLKKFWIILACLLILLIPLQLAKGLIEERYGYKLEAETKIEKAWAGRQNINSPKLYITVDDEEYRLPVKDYNVKVNIKTEIRKKGIFKIPVYTAEVEQTGSFVSKRPVPQRAKSTINMTATDPKGYIETAMIKLGNRKEFIVYGDTSEHIDITGLTKIPFEIKYKLRGINELWVKPDGETANVSIKGNWKDPDFESDFLPVKKVVNKNGFEAEWTIPKGAIQPASENEKCGVSLLLPVDNYKMAHRAVKYGFLFLSLTFMCFYIFEIVTGERVHPLQYIMIGLAMSIFYLLLLSLSEFMNFGAAYFITTAMTVSLITLYTHNVLTKRKKPAFTLTLTGILSFLYLFLYILLLLKDYSLIVGSIGTFLIIAAAMYATKDVQWYKNNDDETSQ